MKATIKQTLTRMHKKINIEVSKNPGGGDSAYERGGNARRKFWIKPLKVDVDL